MSANALLAVLHCRGTNGGNGDGSAVFAGIISDLQTSIASNSLALATARPRSLERQYGT